MTSNGVIPAVGYEITAQVLATDGFWITQGPFTVSLAFGRFRWVWDGATGEFVNGHVTLRMMRKPRTEKE